MPIKPGRSRTRWKTAVAHAVLLCGTAWLLGGCAAPQAASPSGSQFVTASDETEVQRRARIRLELAANYFQSGQTTVALDEVKQALNTYPAYADAFNLRGLIYMRLNDLALAEESFRRALALKPGDAEVIHNHGWLMCQQRRFAEADQQFRQALAIPTYTARSKTLMAQGVCLASAGQTEAAEEALKKAYEIDAGNPVVSYQIAALMHRRGEHSRAQFYIRRLNNAEWANAESLWLGIKIERALGDAVAVRQLAQQLGKRFPDSREWAAYERGAFND